MNRPTIAEMNKAKGKKRLALFARYLETLHHTTEVVTKFNQFNLSSWTGKYNVKRDCGTPSCIAGHAAFISHNGKGVSCAWAMDDAAEWLGISLKVADHLFAPKVKPEAARLMDQKFIIPFHTITPKMAAQAVRRVAKGCRAASTIYAGTPLWPKKARAK